MDGTHTTGWMDGITKKVKSCKTGYNPVRKSRDSKNEKSRQFAEINTSKFSA
jgi:hypothetical protein